MNLVLEGKNNVQREVVMFILNASVDLGVSPVKSTAYKMAIGKEHHDIFTHLLATVYTDEHSKCHFISCIVSSVITETPILLLVRCC